MLLTHLDITFKCFLLFFIFILLVAYTAYRVNLHRDTNDSKKRYYHPGAIVLAPFIALVVIPLGIAAFILAVILYGLFLILFAILLVALRKPFLIAWWIKFSTLVGEPLLRIGTSLILLPFRLLRPRLPEPGSQPAMA